MMSLTKAVKQEIRKRVEQVIIKNTTPQLCSRCGLVKPRTLAHEYRLLSTDVDYCLGCNGADVMDFRVDGPS